MSDNFKVIETLTQHNAEQIAVFGTIRTSIPFMI